MKLLNTAGYLTHIGIGLMFIGILTSSGYSKSVKLNLLKGETKEAFGYQLTFQGEENSSIKNENLLLLQVKKGNDNFIAKPRLYRSEYNQAPITKPHIKRELLEDFYFAPMEYKKKEFAYSEPFTLSKGEEKEIEGYKIKFLDYDLRQHGQAEEVRVGALLEISYQNQRGTAIPYLIQKEQNERTYIEANLPDSNFVFLDDVKPDRGLVTLSIAKKDIEGSGEVLLLEVSKKPLINLLWLGLVVIMLGLFMMTWRRSKEV